MQMELMTEKQKKLIKQYFKSSIEKKCGIRKDKLNLFLQNNKIIENKLNNFLLQHPEYQEIKNIVFCISSNIEELPVCKNCKKPLKFTSLKSKHVYCSVKCSNSDKEKINKTKENCIEKYGSIENYEKIRQSKYQQTNLKKYGSKSPFGNKKVKEKSKKTMLKRYGVVSPMQSDEIRKKINNTNIQKYGYINPFQNEEIKEKIKKSNIKKYGFSHPKKNKKYMKQLSNKIYKKTNYYSYNSTPESRKNKSNAALHNQFIKFLQMKKYVQPLFSQEQYRSYRIKYKWKCKQCNNEFLQSMNYPIEINGEKYPRCPYCYPFRTNTSQGEEQIFNFIKENFDNQCQHLYKYKPYKKQLDIYSNKFKLAIEYDGIYWHSEDINKNKFHLMEKTNLCEKNNILLIHIWENKWKNYQQQVKQKINSFFVLNNKELIFKEINKNEAYDFYEKFSFYNKFEDNCTLFIGGYENNNLYCVSIIKKENEIIKIISYQSIDQSDSWIMQLINYFKIKYNKIYLYNNKRYPINKWVDEKFFNNKIIINPQKYYLNQYFNYVDENYIQKKYSIYDCGINIYIKE